MGAQIIDSGAGIYDLGAQSGGLLGFQVVWGVVEIGRPLKFYAAWGMGIALKLAAVFIGGDRAKIMFCSAFQASVRLCEPPWC